MSLKQRFYNKTALLLTLCLAAAAGHGGFARAEEVHVSETAANVIAGTIQYENAKHLTLLPQETAGVPAGVPRTLAELHLLMMSAGTRLDEEAAQLGMTRDQYVDFLAASLVSAGGGAPEPAALSEDAAEPETQESQADAQPVSAADAQSVPAVDAQSVPVEASESAPAAEAQPVADVQPAPTEEAQSAPAEEQLVPEAGTEALSAPVQELIPIAETAAQPEAEVPAIPVITENIEAAEAIQPVPELPAADPESVSELPAEITMIAEAAEAMQPVPELPAADPESVSELPAEITMIAEAAEAMQPVSEAVTAESLPDEITVETTEAAAAEISTAAPVAPAAEVPQASPVNTNGRRVQLSDYDYQLLAALIFYEAIGEPYEGKVAVANVVINRMLSDKYPSSLQAVVYQQGQFQPACLLAGKVNRGDIPEVCYRAADEALSGAMPVGDAIFFMRKDLHSRGQIIQNHCFWGHM